MPKPVDQPIILPAHSYRKMLATIDRQERLLRILCQSFLQDWTDRALFDAIREVQGTQPQS